MVCADVMMSLQSVVGQHKLMKERKKQTEFKGKVSFDQENEQVKTYDDQTIQSDFLCESLSMDRETRRWRSTEAE